ncbi:MAG: TSUP family transporter [Phycisphaera sp.]|nr:TSUP family transporter [Phycisphaera sp.]
MYIAMGVVLMLGSTIQAATGFAFGLFSITLLLLLGVPPQQAVPIAATCAFAQCATGSLRHRHDVDWKRIVPLALLGALFQPVGVWVLYLLTENAHAYIKPVFGGVVLLAVIAQWLIRPLPQQRLHAGWGGVAFSTGGVMQGLAGMGGPPIVMWVMAHDWNSRVSRATLWSFFLMMIPTNILFYYLRFGDAVPRAVGIGALYIPLVVLGAIPGMWLGNKTSKKRLQQIAFGILILMAAYAIAQPLLFPDPA